VLFLLLDYYLNRSWMADLGGIALWLAIILSVYSGIQYFRAYWSKLNV
jgi:phosphatidylglycerophosphate synthase